MDKIRSVIKMRIDKDRQNEKHTIIKKVYTDLSYASAYTGVNTVLKEARKFDKTIMRKDVVDCLEGERTYTLHKPHRITRYKRLAYIPTGLNSDWQADLADMQKLKNKNDGYAYILVCVELLSRKMYVAPVKSKAASDMISAFEKVFEKAGIQPSRLTTDRGYEFIRSVEIKKYWEEKGITKKEIYSPDIHAGVVERANRTIKERLWKYFYQYETTKWIDVIDKIVEGINNSVNRTIGMSPNSVGYDNERNVFERVYKPKLIDHKREKDDADKKNDSLFKLGDYVMIDKEKGKFEKGYTPNYTAEIFKITHVKNTNPIHYRIADLNGEETLGVFYPENLARVILEPNQRVGEVVEEQGKKVKVRWVGEDREEWINRKGIKDDE